MWGHLAWFGDMDNGSESWTSSGQLWTLRMVYELKINVDFTIYFMSPESGILILLYPFHIFQIVCQ